MLERYRSLAKVTIISICLVICAGGFVRMTGSGMGCPDWPKCFGYWIPPTDISQLPIDYKEIYANRGYDKLDFNVFNTWTEYINRLFGFVSGLLCLGLLVLSILIKNYKLFFWSLLVVLLMAFQAWLGALVVYSVLSPFKITIHMLIALLILSALLLLYHFTKDRVETIKTANHKWLWLALVVSVFQVILGTQVREGVDTLLHYMNRSEVIQNLPFVFEMHRTIAWLVIITNATLIYYYKNLFNIYIELKAILMVIGALLVSGLLMSYHNLLGIYQFFHLIFAVSLYILQLSLLLKQSNFPTLRSL